MSFLTINNSSYSLSSITQVSERERKLIAIANSILENPLHSKEFNFLIKYFGSNKSKIHKCFLDYNLDIFEVENSIYDSLEIRIILHLHNQLAASWHTTKQFAIIDLLKKIKPKSIADIGFGVPTKYVKEYLTSHQDVKIMLYDYSEAAMKFATILLNLWSNDWHNTVGLKKADMRQFDLVGAHDVYMFQDSIEHIPDSEECLKKYITESPQNSKFILSLPIGELIPAHYISWNSNEEAAKWLNTLGLKVIEQIPIYVNLEVDLFAEPLGKDHHDLVLYCSKL